MTLKTKSAGGALALNGNGKLTCECCCSFDIPAMEWQSRSASKSKVGFPEWPGFVGTPPKRYRTYTATGPSWVEFDTGEDDPSNPINGCNGFTSALAAGSLSFTKGYDTDDVFSFNYENPVSTIDGDCGGYSTTVSISGAYEVSEDVLLIGLVNWNGTSWANLTGSGSVSGVETTYLSGTDMQVEEASMSCGSTVLGVDAPCVDVVLSNEYTTAQLITATQAAMPSGWPNTTAGSLRSLSSNELTYSERESEWRVTLPIDLVAGRSYRLFYVVRFTPDTGPAVDEPEDFIAISGDDAGDPIAWQPLAVPDDNGTNSVILVRWECEPFPP
jgi:hypothetical protein